jgi:hypothetical protein
MALEKELRDQVVSFAYGNVKMHNPDLTREEVEKVVDEILSNRKFSTNKRIRLLVYEGDSTWVSEQREKDSIQGRHIVGFDGPGRMNPRIITSYEVDGPEFEALVASLETARFEAEEVVKSVLANALGDIQRDVS